MNPTNTTKQVKDDPMAMFGEMLVGGTSRAIERQEEAGQRELVASDVLPTEGIEAVRAIIEGNGGSIGQPVKGDTTNRLCVLVTCCITSFPLFQILLKFLR